MGKWITADGIHINADNVTEIGYANGRIWIRILGDDRAKTAPDPDGETYKQICQQLGIEEVQTDA